MKILVTGASGFLGKFLVPTLEGQGHEVTEINSRNCDLTIFGSLDQFNRLKFDRIFHLAAWTQAGDFCLHHPGEQWLINQKINTNVLSWWKEAQPDAKLVMMGTSCAYDPGLPLLEENYFKGIPTESLFTYAMTKRMLLAGAIALNRQFGMEYLCFVPSTLFGPGYHLDGRQMHFIFDLIRKIMIGKFRGEPVVLWGDGTQSRELVFVNDFVGTMLRLDSTEKNELINIGAGEEFSIRHFSKLICMRIGYDFERIEFDTGRYVGAKSKCLDIGKLRNKIHDIHFTPLEKGIDMTIEYFMDNKEKILGV